MTEPHIDTDVLIRLLTGDDPVKQAQAKALFQQVEAGQITLQAPDTVIADAVYVLSSPHIYHLPRVQVQALLTPLVRLPGFKVQNRRMLLRALELYATTNSGFGDVMILASMEQRGSRELYSYDQGFDRITRISRLEP